MGQGSFSLRCVMRAMHALMRSFICVFHPAWNAAYSGVPHSILPCNIAGTSSVARPCPTSPPSSLTAWQEHLDLRALRAMDHPLPPRELHGGAAGCSHGPWAHGCTRRLLSARSRRAKEASPCVSRSSCDTWPKLASANPQDTAQTRRAPRQAISPQT